MHAKGFIVRTFRLLTIALAVAASISCTSKKTEVITPPTPPQQKQTYTETPQQSDSGNTDPFPNSSGGQGRIDQINVNIAGVQLNGTGASVNFQIKYALPENIDNLQLQNTSLKSHFTFINVYSSFPNAPKIKHPTVTTDTHINGYKGVSEFELQLSAVPKQGELYVHVKVDSQKGTLLERTYNLGPADNLSSNMTADQITSDIDVSKLHTYVSSLSGVALGPAGMSQSQDSNRSLNSYYYDPMSFKFKGVDRSLETATTRAVNLGIYTCIKDPILFRPVKFKRLKVETFAKIDNPDDFFDGRFNKQPIETLYPEATDPFGCFNFNDRVAFKWYFPERTYIKPFRITDLETGTSKILAAVVNPWNTSWIFAQDLRKVNYSELIDRSEYYPKVLLTTVKMDALGVTYSLNDELKLNLHKKFNFIARPDVIRYDNLTRGSFGANPLKGGFYLLNLALVRKHADAPIQPKDYITSWQQIVAVKNGYITTEVSLSIDNMKLMGARNHLLVQILPINEDKIVFSRDQLDRPSLERLVDQKKTLENKDLVFSNSGLITPTYKAPFIPLQLWQSPGMTEETQVNLQNFIKEAQILQRKQWNEMRNHRTQSAYERRFALNRIELDNEDSLKALTEPAFFNSDSIEDLIRKPLRENHWDEEEKRRLQSKLCRYWANKFLPEQLEKYRAQQDSSDPLPESTIKRILRKFQRRCTLAAREPNGFFNLDHQIIVQQVDPNRFNYMGGMSFNIGVGENFYLNKTQYRDTSRSEFNSMSFSAGIKDDVIPVVDLGLSYQKSWSSSQSEGLGFSRNTSMGHTSGVYLVVQSSLIQFTALSYQKCMVVMPNSRGILQLMEDPLDGSLAISQEDQKYIKSNTDLGWIQRMGRRQETHRVERIRDVLSKEESLSFFESGLRLCEPVETRQPIELTENYYYVTQHFIAGDMQDPADLKNKPWLLSIRSDRDFQVFLRSIEMHNKYQNVFVDGHLPIHQLLDTYREYSDYLPSWPNVVNIKTTNNLSSQDCTHESAPLERVFDTVMDFFKGPTAWKSRPGLAVGETDFFSLFFCNPETYQ